MAGYLSENVRYQAVIIFGFEGHRDSLNIEAMQFEITKILEEVFLGLLASAYQQYWPKSSTGSN